MALEAVVFQQDLFNYKGKDLYNLLGGATWSGSDDLGLEKAYFDETPDNESEKGATQYGNWNSSPPPSLMVPHLHEQCHHHYPYSCSDAEMANGSNNLGDLSHSSTPTTALRPRRRRTKSRKNKEEIEYQRMTHIAVERNRRKQMNEYLSVLRSLMPDSYVQRGDQASIIGGAINFVKELEQQLQSLSSKKQSSNEISGTPSSPFSEFFTFPQYSTSPSTQTHSLAVKTNEPVDKNDKFSATADIEVTMVESHANLKIRCKKRPKQLLKMVSELQTLRLTVHHLNVTTSDQIVLYSLSVKVEENCKLSSVDEIATAVYQMLGRIQEES